MISFEISRACSYLEVVGFVVVHVEGTEELRLSADGYVLRILNPVDDGLTCKLLHLDVVKLPEITEPLDQLRRDAAVKLEIKHTTVQSNNYNLIAHMVEF